METLNASNIDQVKVAAFIAAIFINWRAFSLVMLHYLSLLAYDSIESALYYNLAVGIIYAYFAAEFINISYKCRQVFLSIAVIFWLCAVDAYLFPATETMLYNSYIYIIGALDLYALSLMLKGGGGNGGLFSLLEHWILFLRYRILWLSYNRYQ